MRKLHFLTNKLAILRAESFIDNIMNIGDKIGFNHPNLFVTIPPYRWPDIIPRWLFESIELYKLKYPYDNEITIHSGSRLRNDHNNPFTKRNEIDRFIDDIINCRGVTRISLDSGSFWEDGKDDGICYFYDKLKFFTIIKGCTEANAIRQRTTSRRLDVYCNVGKYFSVASKQELFYTVDQVVNFGGKFLMRFDTIEEFDSVKHLPCDFVWRSWNKATKAEIEKIRYTVQNGSIG